MNYQTFSNLQFRQLLKKFFHSIHIDSRDTSGEQTPLVSVDITRLVLMFRKASNIHFQPKKRCTMVAPTQVEIPFYRGNGRQHGRRCGALAQVIWRTATLFLKKYIVPAGKRVGADLLEFAAPDIAGIVSGRRNFEAAAKNVGKQTLTKQLGSGNRWRTASRVIPTKSETRTNR